MDVKLSTSSHTSYDAGVYDKIEAEAQYHDERGDLEGDGETPPSRLRAFVVASLVLLFIFSLIAIVTSGLVFGHRVSSSGDCLAQSCVMFAAIMGFLYICLHLQAAYRGDPVNRARPSFQHPLHSSAVVVARIDIIAWIICLMVVSVSVSKNPSPISSLNLVACVFVTPTLIFLVCVVEKASRPFDLPYINSRSSEPSSLVTCRVSALMKHVMLPEVTSDDSISRRGSASSTRRLNSNTQHAAAIAASTVGKHTPSGGLSGPRPPPASVKEAKPWAFNKFDDRTKKQLSDSVSEASHKSETRPRVGGPRPLPTSDIAVKTGILPPPICTEPKSLPRLPEPETSKELVKAGPATPSSGAWKGDWSALKNITGWYSPANSSVTTPASTPGTEHAPRQPKVRPLSTVAEHSVQQNRGRKEITYPPMGTAAPASPVDRNGPAPPAAVTLATTRRGRAATHTTAPPSSSATGTPNRPRTLTGPRDTQQQQIGFPRDGASVPRPPPSAAASGPVRAPTTARVRLQRAQDALKTNGRTSSGTMVLNRPQRLTGERRRPEDDRRRLEEDRRRAASDDRTVALRAPVRSGSGDVRPPGYFVD
ncbi:hypothetical protein SLS53_005042 [Cytospora paraplurivora]|uniref:Uncharacterized protein n=1 Tax=Cytospora paraplurivora TaxID=2898453 RepID=A0AAN9YGH9_9PEZI